MGYTYATFVTALAAATGYAESDTDFVAFLPTGIDDAEQVCYRELGLLEERVVLAGNLTANTRYFTIPTGSGHVLTIESANVLNDTDSPPIKAASTRTQLVPATREIIDCFWPSDTAAAATTKPNLINRCDDARILVGPPPGSAWQIEIVATIRPAALSVSNTTTFLTNYLSDLFFAAAMVSATGNLLKNFGAQSDNPQQAVSWKSQFEDRLASAKNEELRKKYISAMSVGITPPKA